MVQPIQFSFHNLFNDSNAMMPFYCKYLQYNHCLKLIKIKWSFFVDQQNDLVIIFV